MTGGFESFHGLFEDKGISNFTSACALIYRALEVISSVLWELVSWPSSDGSLTFRYFVLDLVSCFLLCSTFAGKS